jgi:glycosyltransferase involved in cell wall biosynthesis
MKILITSDSYLPRLGGAEVYAYQLATFLKKNGHEVEIMTTEAGTWIKDSENITHRFVWNRNPVSIIRFFIDYYKLIKNVDIVHSIYSHKLAAIAGFLCLFTKTKLVVSLQGRGILDLPSNSLLYAKLHKFYRTVSLKLAYKVVASCHEFADIAKIYTNESKIVYLPNLVDIEEFSDVEKDYSLLPFKYTGDEDLVFTIRRLVRKNGVQFAVEAMPEIIRNNPRARLVAIGWGPLEEYLKKRVIELHIEDYVYFVGRVENFHLKKMLSLADVVLFPSTAESTSIACLESMSLSKPIVASNVGGYPEMVTDGQNGFLVNLTDTLNSDYDAPMTLSIDKINALANAVNKILLNRELKNSFSNKSRELAEQKFSWQKNISKIIGLYN